jgi:long-chain acyl-CoA synthetase
VVNCNPLYTPRELEHQLNDAGAAGIVILENFAKTLEDVIAKTAVKKVVTTQLGDMLPFPKSMIVNWVVKHRKKMVPAWNIPDTVPLKKALADGRARALVEPALTHDDIAFLQYTGGTDRRLQGRHAHPRQHRREPAAGVGVDRHGTEGGRRAR